MVCYTQQQSIQPVTVYPTSKPILKSDSIDGCFALAVTGRRIEWGKERMGIK